MCIVIAVRSYRPVIEKAGQSAYRCGSSGGYAARVIASRDIGVPVCAGKAAYILGVRRGYGGQGIAVADMGCKAVGRIYHPGQPTGIPVRTADVPRGKAFAADAALEGADQPTGTIVSADAPRGAASEDGDPGHLIKGADSIAHQPACALPCACHVNGGVAVLQQAVVITANQTACCKATGNRAADSAALDVAVIFPRQCADMHSPCHRDICEDEGFHNSVCAQTAEKAGVIGSRGDF